MTQNNNDSNANPLQAWKQLRDSMIETWSKAMTDIVSSDAYAQATGMMLDNYLTMTAPMQEAVDRTMEPILAQLNMPSRTEVISLANRLTNIEVRLDDLDARLDTIQAQMQSIHELVGGLDSRLDPGRMQSLEDPQTSDPNTGS